MNKLEYDRSQWQVQDIINQFVDPEKSLIKALANNSVIMMELDELLNTLR